METFDRAETPPGDGLATAATRWLEELRTSLDARGFKVRVEDAHWSLVATNEAPPDEESPLMDPLALAFGPVKLTQRVQLAERDGGLAWFWQWSGPTRNAPGTHEYLCPAAAITEATERISRVLALAGSE